MIKFIKLFVAVMLLTGLQFMTGCSGNEAKENPEKQADAVNEEKLDDQIEKDADRLVELYSSNLYETKASEQAAMRANTTDVKKLAGMMAASHTKMTTDLRALATSKNITLPSDMTDKQQRDLQDLSERTGFDYDKLYTRQMKDMHEEAIKLVERTADKSEDAEIKQWATSAVPELKSHLEMVEATRANVKEIREETREDRKEKNTWEGKSEMHDGRHDIHDDKHDKN